LGWRARKREMAMAERRDAHNVPVGPAVFVEHVHYAHNINTHASEEGGFESYQWVTPNWEPNHNQVNCYQVESVVGEGDGKVTCSWLRAADVI